MQSIISASLPDCKPKMGNTIDIYTLAHTRKRRPQDVTDNIYLNDNKCNTLTEDGAIKTIMEWILLTIVK